MKNGRHGLMLWQLFFFLAAEESKKIQQGCYFVDSVFSIIYLLATEVILVDRA